MSTREVGQSDRKVIEKFLAMDEDELYATIFLYMPEYRGTLFSQERQVELGKELFSTIEGELRHHLCERWRLCDKIERPEWNDMVTLVAAIGDVIATKITNEISPFTIGALLVKIGLRVFCKCGS